MSSEISTDSTGFRPWHFFVLASLLAATAATLLSRRPEPANLILISLTIGAAGCAGIGLYRTLAPLTRAERDAAPEALGRRSRAALEREKVLVLRTIKELEFDRAMGKVSDQDFEEMAGRLRARAITLMKQLDAEGTGYRQFIERELRTRLGDAGAVPARAEASVPARAETPATARTEGVGAAGSCPGCGTRNDADARFCNQCGARLEVGTSELVS